MPLEPHDTRVYADAVTQSEIGPTGGGITRSPMDDIEKTYGLKCIDLTDKTIFDEAFSLQVAPLSDYTFANTFIWRNGLKVYWRRFEGYLCVFANGSGDLTMLLPPMGDGDLGKCLDQCFELMDAYNAGERSHSLIEYVSEESLAGLRHYGIEAAPMGCDYVYETQKMIDLAGGDLKSKRQARSKFLREHDVNVEPLQERHVAACKALLHDWQGLGDTRHTSQDPIERNAAVLRLRDTWATELALEERNALGLRGMVLFADGRLIGFTLGEPLGGTQASILIEKTDLNVYGAAQYIFSEFCRLYWSGYSQCNVGDDWGIPSLRWTKESYRPIRLLAKYAVRRRPVLTVGVGSGHTVTEISAVESDVVPALMAAPNPRHLTSAGVPEPRRKVGDVTIEAALPSDLSGLAQLEREIFDEKVAVNKRQIRYLLRSPRSIVAVARTSEGQIVGSAIVLLRKHRRYRSARLYSLAVDGRYRGEGLGQRLAEYVLDRTAEAGAHRCFLEVSVENQPAMRLYERLGFVPLATLPDYYGAGHHGRRMLRVSRSASVTPPPLSKPVGTL